MFESVWCVVVRRLNGGMLIHQQAKHKPVVGIIGGLISSESIVCLSAQGIYVLRSFAPGLDGNRGKNKFPGPGTRANKSR